MHSAYRDYAREELARIESAGLTKREAALASPQGTRIRLADGRELLNFCANNYLGLANHPRLVRAARDALDRWGYGMASVRFICGTQDLHRELEEALSAFLGTEDTLLYSSCFDANGGLFETLLGEQDAVISDELNHASIIDGIRLCKARRLRYRNNDMADLEARLVEARDARFRLIATDGVFSMDGVIADLRSICDLAERHDALVMVDDSHAVGFLGANGRGTPEYRGVLGRVDLITGTLGKALGGASGGYTSGRRELIALLRQRSRPYLFSNALPPPIVAASIEALKLAGEPEGAALREKLRENTRGFRAELTRRGLNPAPGEHPIVPILYGEADRAAAVARGLRERGIYVVAFSYPVVPMGRARIRMQISAAHERADLEQALAALEAL